jgi:hypothetical protein
LHLWSFLEQDKSLTPPGSFISSATPFLIFYFFSPFNYPLFAWMWSTSSFCTFSFPTEGSVDHPVRLFSQLSTILYYLAALPPHDPILMTTSNASPFRLITLAIDQITLSNLPPVLDLKNVWRNLCFFVSSLTFSVLI